MYLFISVIVIDPRNLGFQFMQRPSQEEVDSIRIQAKWTFHRIEERKRPRVLKQSNSEEEKAPFEHTATLETCSDFY